MEILYHTIVSIATLAASPFILLRMALSEKFRQEMLARHRGGNALSSLPGCLWIHASSAGEVRAAKILIDALDKKGGHPHIFLSTFTKTGYDLARMENIQNVFRLPFDFPLWLNPVFDKLKPSQLILIEAEFWPSLLRTAKRRNIPVVLVNGRMSERSARRYQKVLPFFRWITDPITVFSMRTQGDANRALALGVPAQKVRVTGNIKFGAQTNSTRQRENKPEQKFPWVVFGSTRPGDEGPIMQAVARLKKDLPDLNVAIAPRHVDRSPEVESLILESDVKFKLHSELAPDKTDLKGTIILVDKMGELKSYYAHATVAFVGGGFNPRFGGQNILEPAALGIPVVYGKHMQNFQEEARLLKESGGGVQIDHPKELYPVLYGLLTQPEERERRGQSAARAIKENQGAVQRNIDLIEQTET